MRLINLTASFLLALTMSFLLGCASTPYEGDGKNRSDVLLKQQLDTADQALSASSNGRIIFVGFAPNSQSKAFRNDVLVAEKLVRELDSNAIIFKLSNPAWGQSADWPFATAENMSQVLNKVSLLTRAQDKVILLLSTHGNVNRLSINFAKKELPNLDSLWISRNLMGLRGKQTLILISACYSGSFIDPLAGPSRIILTAASKDKNSFGCAFHDPNTYFIDALLNQPATSDFSVLQLMERAKKIVAHKESLNKLTPSDPQMNVGNTARNWVAEPLKNWIKP